MRVHFATNRNAVAGPDMFGSGFRTERPGRYVVGTIEVNRVSDRPDTGYEPDRATLRVTVPPDAAPAGAAEPVLAAVTSAQTDGGDLVVLIHGFAASFVDALRRAGQIADAYRPASAPPMNVLAISWPANGAISVPDYRADRDDAQRSAPDIADLLQRLLRWLAELPHDERPKVHLVAHSMGAFALRHALQTVRERAPDLLRTQTLHTALLMASDEDFDALDRASRLAALPRMARRVAVYWAARDQALAASQNVLGNGNRLGLVGVPSLSALPANVSTIDCSEVSRTFDDAGRSHFRHQYYRLSPRVLADIRQVVAGRAPHQVTGRLREADPSGRAFWLPFDDPDDIVET